nr:DNA-protecting protein DprA [Candidatus Coxiella mudrowiae]
MSGLVSVLGTVVVEAALGCGSLITVQLAAEQN